MSRLSRSHSELRVRMLDYDDFSSAGKDDVSKFFRDIGTLNAVFRKRLNQSFTLHPCVPLADLFQEYIAYQRALEGKYNISFPTRTARTSATMASPASPPALPLNPLQPFGSFSSSTSSTSAAVSTPPTEPKSIPSTSSADDNARPSKRKAEYDRDGEEVPKKSDQVASAQPSGIPKPTSSAAAPVLADSRSFESRLRKPTVTLKPPEQPKKPIFEGFNLPKPSVSTAQPPSFGSIFSSFSAADMSAGAKKGVSDRVAQENHTGGAEKKATETPEEDAVNFTFKGFASQKSQEPPSASVAPPDNSVKPSENASKSIFGTAGLSFGSGFGTGSSIFPGFQPGATFSSFGAFNIPKPSGDDDEAKNDEGGEEPYEPPVVAPEEQEVAETDAVISSKCKVFYLDGKEFKSRGVGTAHLKTISEDAIQLLIRVATSIGTVLLNTRLTKDTKVSRGSRNKSESVDVLCLADPAIKGIEAKKPVQFVIKFKDAPVADEFYNKIQEMLKK